MAGVIHISQVVIRPKQINIHGHDVYSSWLKTRLMLRAYFLLFGETPGFKMGKRSGENNCVSETEAIGWVSANTQPFNKPK